MKKEIEIERKFLLRKSEIENYLKNIPKSIIRELSIEQFYIEISDKREIRYRMIKEDRQSTIYLKTIKTGSGISRTEEEFPVDIVEYQSFIMASSIIINKVRYIVGDLEFDFYSDGLRILEKEYPTEKEALEDVIDFPFINKEVTGDKYFSNAQIALRSSKKDF